MNALPIINSPKAEWHMTSDEWKKIHRDFKGVSLAEAKGYRFRTAMKGSPKGIALYHVFLTDKKIKEV